MAETGEQLPAQLRIGAPEGSDDITFVLEMEAASRVMSDSSPEFVLSYDDFNRLVGLVGLRQTVEYQRAKTVRPEATTPDDEWTRRNVAACQFMSYIETDDDLIPAAAVSLQVAIHPDAPEDYDIRGLTDRVFAAIDEAVTRKPDDESDDIPAATFVGEAGEETARKLREVVLGHITIEESGLPLTYNEGVLQLRVDQATWHALELNT